jgi:hypothetical protein
LFLKLEWTHMRNYLWSGTLVLLVGVGLYVAAQHAARYPHSFVGRCAMTIYHMWDPLLAPADDDPPHPSLAQADPSKSPPRVQAPPSAEPIEPIVVEPTDQEPPLALPRLSPEIAAAIERLRGEEESEAPPKAFDSPGRILRMPYADEGMDTALGLARALAISAPCGCFLLPPTCWQTILKGCLHSSQE